MPSFPTLSRIPSAMPMTPVTNGALVVQFGDGYTARGYNSIKPTYLTWQLSFESLTQTDINTLDAFLIPKMKVISFDWTHPLSSTTYTVICEEYSNNPKNKYYSVSIKLRQVFND